MILMVLCFVDALNPIQLDMEFFYGVLLKIYFDRMNEFISLYMFRHTTQRIY